MNIKRFKNGNFTAKIDGMECKQESTLVNLLWGLYDADCVLFGKEYCLGNFDMAVDVYCYYTDKVVTIPYSVFDELNAGKTVRLYAHKPNEYEREELERLEELGEL